jgi:hypothetical protein
MYVIMTGIGAIITAGLLWATSLVLLIQKTKASAAVEIDQPQESMTSE